MSKPIIAGTGHLDVCGRLMRWAFRANTPAFNKLPLYEEFILNEISARLSGHLQFWPNLDRRIVFSESLLDSFLHHLFVMECQFSTWGRVITQHLGIRIKNTFRTSPLPYFMWPMHCISCGNPLSGISPDNYDWFNKFRCAEEDNPTHRDCEKFWLETKTTFEHAFNGIAPDEGISMAEHLEKIRENLNAVLGAYYRLSEYLEQEGRGSHIYIPRYTIIEEYKDIDFTRFLIFNDAIITEEDLPPMFKPELIGKLIWPIEDKDGNPYNAPAGTDVVTLNGLKQFLIKKPRRLALMR